MSRTILFSNRVRSPTVREGNFDKSNLQELRILKLPSLTVGLPTPYSSRSYASFNHFLTSDFAIFLCGLCELCVS
jgi:hypothetical protein